MINEQDEIAQFLSSEVTYWDGLRSSEFWSEYKEKGLLTSSIAYLLVFWVGLFTLIFNPIHRNITLKIIFALLLLGLISSLAIQFNNQLRFFQLNKQLRLIKLAQELKSQETGEERENESA